MFSDSINTLVGLFGAHIRQEKQLQKNVGELPKILVKEKQQLACGWQGIALVALLKGVFLDIWQAKCWSACDVYLTL